jgi:hypothetical protein
MKAELSEIFYNEDMRQKYFSLNRQMIEPRDLSDRVQDGRFWPRMTTNPDTMSDWKLVEFPSALFLGRSSHHHPHTPIVKWNGQELPAMRFLMTSMLSFEQYQPFPTSDSDKLTIWTLGVLSGLVLIWTSPRIDQPKEKRYQLAFFPPEWINIVGINVDGVQVYNKDNILKYHMKPSEWHSDREIGTGRINAIPPNTASSFEELNTWMLSKVWRDSEFWEGLRDNYPDVYRGYFEQVREKTGQPFLPAIWSDPLELDTDDGLI